MALLIWKKNLKLKMKSLPYQVFFLKIGDKDAIKKYYMYYKNIDKVK